MKNNAGTSFSGDRPHCLAGPRLLLAILGMLILAMKPAAAQKQKHSVQLSGFVTAGDSTAGLAGAAVYLPDRNQSTLTQQNGFFSIAVFTGDSIVFSALGYQRQYLVIPETLGSQHYTDSIHLQENPTALPTVDVMPWATERDFKQAVLGVKLPPPPSINTNIGPTHYNSLLDMPAMGADGNFKYFQQQQTQQRQKRHQVPDIIRLFSVPIK